MEPNRAHRPLPGRLDLEIFDSFGEEDSIVDRLMALPVVPQIGDVRPNVWETGVARRLEKRVADQMRERLDGERRPQLIAPSALRPSLRQVQARQERAW